MPSQMPHPASRAFASFLQDVSLAPHQAHKSFTLWPIVRGDRPSHVAAYVTLSEAIARGDLVADELPTGPSVPHVLLANRGPSAVLVLFGEEIRGANQNRVAHASFLIPPHGKVVIDVSCVERGRWSRRPGATFTSTGEILSNDLRRRMSRHVYAARRAGRRFHADQSELWDDVGQRVRYSNADTRSEAYADYVRTRSRDLEELAQAFRAVPGQVGFIACVGDEVAGLEVIGHPEVFAKAFRGLVRAYLIDAVDHALLQRRQPGGRPAVRFDGPESFLAALAEAPMDVGPSLGLGSDLRIANERISGCALVAEEVVHLTAFPSTVHCPEDARDRRATRADDGWWR